MPLSKYLEQALYKYSVTLHSCIYPYIYECICMFMHMSVYLCTSKCMFEYFVYLFLTLNMSLFVPMSLSSCA